MSKSFCLIALVCGAVAGLAAQTTEPPQPGKVPPPAPAPAPNPPVPGAPANPAAPSATAQGVRRVLSTVGTQPQKKTVAEIIKKCDETKGLFTLYRDRENGTVYLFVKRKQLNREFIYFSHTLDGIVAAGQNRGQFHDSEVFVIHRNYDKLEFIEQNLAFYFDPQHPLARAAGANVSHAVLASEGIAAENEEGFLVNAGNLFLRESFEQVRHGGGKDDTKNPLGKLSESKTKFVRIKSYHRNTLFVVEYVYENPTPPHSEEESRSVGDMADPRYVSIKVQHTFIAMPHNDYQPRVDDPRVGYFTTEVTDQVSTEVTPWRDFIHRWDLKKKDPAAPLSEPVKPIVWWIENTTPREFRDTIREAGLRWNKAFEKIGYKDAVVIKEQPDNAKWEAGDIDYNVLRWTSSPKPPFGGYGPSFVNPRTGQILGSDIMLEFGFIKNRIMAQRIWSELGLAGMEQAVPSGLPQDPHACLDASALQQGLMFGRQMMRLRAADEVEMAQMIREALIQLVLHEMGHTMGLTHNFRASYLHTPQELQDRALTERTGLSGSVMDYMPLNLGPDKQHQGQYYITNPGPYDDWAIQYGYSDALPDAAAESKRLAVIAARSNERELAYANDADDMRAPGKSIDPRAMIFDMSSDPVAYGVQRCEMVHHAMDRLLVEVPQEGKSWQEVTQSYISLTTEASNGLTCISRYIGGVYVERPFVKQVAQNAPDPLRPVDKATQKAAMAALAKYAFDPSAWTTSEALLRHLQQQRRGFSFRAEGEDPKVHERVLKIQRALLDHLLHPNTQNRILDSSLYGNTYSLGEVMGDLTKAIVTPKELDAPITSMRQDIQIDYVDRLIGIVKGRGQLPAAQSVALYQLKQIQEAFVAHQGVAPDANKPHVEYVLYKISRGLEDKTP